MCFIKTLCLSGFLFLLNFISLSAQGSYLDSLYTELDKTSIDTHRVNLLLDIASTYIGSNKSQVIDKAQQAHDLSHNINYNLGKTSSLYIIGLAHHLNGDYKEAMNTYEQSFDYAKKDHEAYYLYNLHMNMGAVYEFWGQLDIAMQYYHNGIALVDKSRDPIGYSSFLINIGNLYIQMGDAKKAIQYKKEGLAIFRERKLPYKTVITLNNLGEAYQIQKEYNKAIACFQEGLSISQKENFPDFIAASCANLGSLYIELGELAKAKKHLTKALSIGRELEKDEYLAETLIFIGQLSQKEGRYYEANNYFIECLDISIETGRALYEKKAYEHLIEIQSVTGDYKKSFEYQEQLIALNDSLFSETSNSKMLELSTKYETAKKETENKLLKEQQARSNIELKQKNTLVFGMIIILLLVCLMSYILYKSNLQRKDYNSLLTKEIVLLNKNIENKKVIEEQATQLAEVEKQKNILFTNIAHEFQTPLSIIQGLSRQVYKSDELYHTSKEYLQVINRNSAYLSEAVNKILTINSSNQTSEYFTPVRFVLSELIDFIIPEYIFAAKQKSITIETNIKDFSNIKIYSDLEKISTILKNLISNAIKYSNRNGHIALKYIDTNQKYHEIKVIDNGEGIAEDELPSIFDRYFQSNNKIAGGFGLGLAICQDFIKSIDGEIKVESTIHVGTTFTVLIPKNSTEELKSNNLYEFPEQSFPEEIALQKPSTHKVKNNIDILIVEDNLDFCKYLKSLLSEDYNLLFVHNGKEALELLNLKKPSIIITDFMMQEMDGLSLVKNLKTSKEFHQIPILMLTARNLTSDKIKLLRIGVDDYVTKPVEDEILIDRINLLLNIQEEKRFDINSHFLSNHEGGQISVEDQNWLFEIEKTIFPLIKDFDLNLDKIASICNLTPRQIGRKIKTITGFTAKKYIQEIRYWEARRLLESKEESSVKIVSYTVGFKNVKHFSRKFKERFGVYPSDYI